MMKPNSIAVFLVRSFLPVTAAIIISGCPDSTNPPPPLPVRTLDIYPFQHAPEVNIGENLYLGGVVKDEKGVAQRGIRVNFSVSPDSIAVITRWADTLPDSASGFETRVTFNGSKSGTALITGEFPLLQTTIRDTLSILVRGAING